MMWLLVFFESKLISSCRRFQTSAPRSIKLPHSANLTYQKRFQVTLWNSQRLRPSWIAASKLKNSHAHTQIRACTHMHTYKHILTHLFERSFPHSHTHTDIRSYRFILLRVVSFCCKGFRESSCYTIDTCC